MSSLPQRKCTIVCIDGNIGSGKSTLIRNLLALEQNFKCFEEPVDKWTLLPYIYNQNDPNIIHKRSVYGMALQYQILISQFDQYKQNFEKEENDLIIVERCPWTSKNIFAPLFFITNSESFKCYETIYDTLSYSVDYLIYLKVPAEIAYDRILKRNRECQQQQQHNQSIPLHYLHLLEERYEHKMEEIRLTNKVFEIDATKPLNEILEEVVYILKYEIPREKK